MAEFFQVIFGFFLVVSAIIGVIGLFVSGVRGVFRIPEPSKHSDVIDEPWDEEAENAKWEAKYMNKEKN